MIPYAELDRALKRWKARQSGGAVDDPAIEEPHTEVTADAVVSETDTRAHFEGGSGLIEVEFERSEQYQK
jgi:hypothetical protein